MPAPEQLPARGSWLSVLMALAAAAIIFVGLFMLTGGAIAAPLVAGFAIFAVVTFHYLVWGWWLSKLIRHEAEADEREQAGLPK